MPCANGRVASCSSPAGVQFSSCRVNDGSAPRFKSFTSNTSLDALAAPFCRNGILLVRFTWFLLNGLSPNFVL
eukprot:133493-Amphidinium_carterae.1